MTTLVYVETIDAPFAPYGADIHDLWFAFDGSDLSLYAYAGNLSSARIVEFDVSSSASFTAQTFLGAATDGFQAADYGSVTLHLSASRLDTLTDVDPGQMAEATALTSLNNGTVNDLVSLVATDIGGATYLVSSRPDEVGIAVFQQNGDGSLRDLGGPDISVGQISDLATVTAYANTWILATSLATDSVESYSQASDGTLTHMGSFGATQGLGVNTPTVLSPVMLDGQPYVIIGASDSGSLSVLRLEADGSFTATDHILDDLNTRFDDVQVLETATVGDTTFVLVAGSDDGIALFQMRPTAACIICKATPTPRPQRSTTFLQSACTRTARICEYSSPQKPKPG